MGTEREEIDDIVDAVRDCKEGPVDGRCIDFKNRGPIKRLHWQLHDGVNVLRGRNGCGKTAALDAVDALLNGGKLSVRDGEECGSVEGLGVKLLIGRSTRRTGELEVSILDGKMSVADLVDPGLKDHGAADARRIKALIGLTDVKADIALFFDCVGGAEVFDEIGSAKSAGSTDLVEMARLVKADLDKAARHHEERSAYQAGVAKSGSDSIQGVDLEGPHDREALQTAATEAVRRLDAMGIEQMHILAACDAGSAARQAIATAEAAYEGPTVADAATAEADASLSCKARSDERERCEGALDDALAAETAAHDKVRALLAALAAAEHHHETMDAWCKQVEAGAIANPICTAEIERARQAVVDAQDAVIDGGQIREARARSVSASEAVASSVVHKSKAASLRESAKSVDSVLSGVVAQTGCTLRVEAGRLVTETVRGKSTLFAELSQGERWRITLDLAIDQVGEGGIIPLPQEAWEGLDPVNQAAIHNQSAAAHVAICTAVATDGELEPSN